MSTLGVIVVAGDGAATARSLDSLVRQRHPIDAVTIVIEASADRRLQAWLTAVAAARRWQLVASASPHRAVAFNTGLATLSTDWVIVVEAGDILAPTAMASLRDAWARRQSDTAGFLTGLARLTGLGVDTVPEVTDPQSPAALDPGHPALRSIVWRRTAVAEAGGFDETLPASERYDLWLGLLARGIRGEPVAAVLLQCPVEAGAPLPTELERADYLAAIAKIAKRHLALLAARVGDVLEQRARRVSALGAAHLAALARHHAAQRELQALAAFDAPPALASGWRGSPLSRQWGYDRGGPLDRHYIERFLAGHADDVHGHVLEVQEAEYARRFGGDAVTRSDVVDLVVANAGATIIADLRCAANIADATYDCVVLTQTMHVIAPMDEVVAECHRILRPGGVLLLTAPAVSRVCLEYGRDGDYWRLTAAGARRLLEPVFGNGVEVSTFGNAAASSAFLQGIGRDEVPAEVLAARDIYNPTIVCVRAVKAGRRVGPAVHRGRRQSGAVLLYHRVGGSDPDPHRISIDRDAFARQVAWLAGSCAVIGVDELVEGASRRTLPPRAVALTFDDGYVDTWSTAAPVLAAHNLPATCFVSTVGLDGHHAFWWDELAAALLGDGPRPASLTITLPDGARTLPMATRGERLFAHGLIYHSVVGTALGTIEQVLGQLRAWAPGAALSDDCRRMNAAQIRDVSAAGMRIGAHTVDHPQLPRLSKAEQIREIADSRAALERITGTPVTSLAYPFGAYDATTTAAAADAGITHGFTCQARLLTAADPLLQLPRLDPQTAQLELFIARVESLMAGAS